MKFVPVALTLMMLATPAAALTIPSTTSGTFSYEFDEQLDDHFSRVVDNGLFFGQPLVPSDNELEYNNTGMDPNVYDNNEAYIYDVFSPGYNQLWSVSVDLMIPLDYDAFASNVEDAYAEIGLAVGFLPSGDPDPNASFFATVLELDRFNGSTERSIASDLQVREEDSVAESFFDANGVEKTRVTISFDPNSKVLSATSDQSLLPVLEVDVEDPNHDWGMTSGDVFSIVLFAGSGGEDNFPIGSSEPLELDNFLLEVVPEPTSVALLLCSLAALLGLPRYCR